MEGFNYVGAGNSTNKKDSQSNAALDFCQFLVRSGNLNQQDLPKMVGDFNSDSTLSGNLNFWFQTLEGSGGGANEAAGNSNPSNQLPRGMVAPHQSMGIIFNDRNNQQSDILPYKRGPNAAYMDHVNQIGNRKMLEEVLTVFLVNIWLINKISSTVDTNYRRKKRTLTRKCTAIGHWRMPRVAFTASSRQIE